MGNIYGTAMPVLVPTIVAPAADVPLPSGTETTVIASAALAALSAGSYYLLVHGVMTVYMGATPPTSLVIALRKSGGSDVATFTVDPGQLVANAKVQFPFVLVSAVSSTDFSGAGVAWQITGNGAAQATTAKQVGSSAIFQIFRGTDLIP